MSSIAKQLSVPVPLDGYLNWKGVSWPAKGIVAQVDPHGSSLPGEALPNHGMFKTGEQPFIMPRTDSDEDDLISCEGQRIAIPVPCKSAEILILGFAVFGDYADQIGLCYVEGNSDDTNGAVEVRAFGLTDWFQYLPGKPAHYGEEAGIILPYYLDDEGVAQRPVALWVQRIPADPARTLEALQLPDNSFMYIMAITLITP